MAAGEVSDQLFDAFEFGKRLDAAEQVLAERDPILVASGFVAKAALAYIAHQPGGEDSERGAEEKSDRDEAVFRGPDQWNFDVGDFYSAGNSLIFGRAERRTEY